MGRSEKGRKDMKGEHRGTMDSRRKKIKCGERRLEMKIGDGEGEE